MKKSVIFYLIFIISLSLHSQELSFTQKEKEFIQNTKYIKIGMMDDFIPFSFIKDGRKIGYSHDLLEEISKISGLKFKIINGNWPDLYEKFSKNKIHMLSELSYREERTKFTNFTSPYYEIPIGVFTKKDFDNYKDITSLKNKKVGIIKDSYIKKFLKENEVKIVEYKNSSQRLHDLNNEVIDAVITNVMNIYEIEKKFFSNIKLSGIFEHPNSKSEDLRFGIRKEYPILSSIINKSLNSIPFSTISKIKQDWILSLNNKYEIDLTNEEREWKKSNIIKIGIESAKPYIFYDKDKNNDGLYFDILKNVLNKTNLKVEFVYNNWSELLKKFEKNEIDLLPATFYSKEREKIGFFSKSFYKVREYIYVKSENNTIHKLSHLNGKKVALTQGYETINKIKKKYPKIEIIETSGLKESVNKVLNNEVDALIDYHLVVENYIKDSFILGLKSIAQNSLEPISVHFLSNKKKPILKNILEKGLNSISKEEKSSILKKWSIKPFNIKDNIYVYTNEELKFLKTHKKIRFGFIAQKPPFEFIKDKKITGISIDYIKKSAEKVGLNIEFVYEKMKVYEAYNMIETNREKFDTLVYGVKTQEKEKSFSYGIDFLSYPMMIMKYKNSSYIASMKDLRNKTIVLEENYLTNKWIKNDFPQVKIVTAPTTKDALKLLNDKKVDAYVGNLAVSNYMSLFEGLDNIEVAAPSGYGDIKYNFVAPKQWPELTSLLSKGYKQITPIEHSVIQQKWFSLQTINKIDYSLLWKIIAISLFIILWILWWNRKLSVEKDKTNEILKKLKIAKDKLEQKNIEVEDSKNFLKSVLDETPDPIIIKDNRGNFLLVNKSVANLYNTSIENMIGKNDNHFNKLPISNFFNKDIKEIIKKDKIDISYESFFNNILNETTHYMLVKKPFRNRQEEKLILIYAKDITNIKKLEEEQLLQQKMLLNQSKIAAMGEMLGNISHQWRQPLSIITTQASTINLLLELEEKISKEKLFDFSESIINQANYLSKTIDDFRDFFISNSTTRQDHNLKNIFLKLESLVKIAYENNFIKIINDIEDNIDIYINENILIQALVNIFNNAKDAFSLNKINSEDRYLFITIKKEKENIVLTFKDSAGGIEEENINKIFEPYFTTKHQSLGTGIGLYMTNQIITKHLKGKITAENESYNFQNKKYKGAKFTIVIPSEI